MKRLFKHCKAMVSMAYYGKFIMDHANLIEELKKWQSELNVGDPKITKIDNVIIKLERRYLDSNNKINMIKSGS